MAVFYWLIYILYKSLQKYHLKIQVKFTYKFLHNDQRCYKLYWFTQIILKRKYIFYLLIIAPIYRVIHFMNYIVVKYKIYIKDGVKVQWGGGGNEKMWVVGCWGEWLWGGACGLGW